MRTLLWVALVCSSCVSPLESFGDLENRQARWTRLANNMRDPFALRVLSASAPREGAYPLSMAGAAALDQRCPGLVRSGQNRFLATLRCSLDASPGPKSTVGKIIIGRDDDEFSSTALPPNYRPIGPIGEQLDCKRNNTTCLYSISTARQGATTATAATCVFCGQNRSTTTSPRGVVHDATGDHQGERWYGVQGTRVVPDPRSAIGRTTERAMDEAERSGRRRLSIAQDIIDSSRKPRGGGGNNGPKN